MAKQHQIDVAQKCTRCPNKFFHYRRAEHCDECEAKLKKST